MDSKISAPEKERERCWGHGADPARVIQGTRSLLSDETYYDLAETFRALADSNRAKIVYSLLGQELCTCDLAAIVGITEPGVSHHLRTLRYLRLVKSRREGKLVFYSLDDHHVKLLLDIALRHVAHLPSEAAEEGIPKHQV